MRKPVELPKKDNRRILTENQRKFIAYHHNRNLKYTPVWWQKRYMKIWGVVWMLGKLALILFFLAFIIGMTAILLGIK